MTIHYTTIRLSDYPTIGFLLRFALGAMRYAVNGYYAVHR